MANRVWQTRNLSDKKLGQANLYIPKNPSIVKKICQIFGKYDDHLLETCFESF